MTRGTLGFVVAALWAITDGCIAGVDVLRTGVRRVALGPNRTDESKDSDA